jgi:hypothetical protein
LKGQGEINTPFSTDSAKERESVIQQTFWIYMGAITGEDYQEEDFEANVFEQYEEVTGVPVSTLPEPEKEKLTSGVEVFWTVFVATGVEAKVLSAPVSGSEDSGNTLIKDEKKTKANQKGNCACDTMELFVGINIERKADNMISEVDNNQIVTFATGKSDVTLSEIKARASNVEKGKKVEVNLTTKLNCNCSVEWSDCPQTRDEIIKIMYGEEELKKSFILGKIPYKIKITVIRTCEGEDCTKKTCTVTLPVTFKNESLKDKEKREKEEKEAAEKAKKEKEEKEAAEKAKKEKESKSN